ncbi:MAG: hypothetical protein Q8S84_07160 [bacterium]|nr:hypothetical protein [bacterium]MDP3381235.1 hypothetical protein [bacterium]
MSFNFVTISFHTVDVNVSQVVTDDRFVHADTNQYDKNNVNTIDRLVFVYFCNFIIKVFLYKLCNYYNKNS